MCRLFCYYIAEVNSLLYESGASVKCGSRDGARARKGVVVVVNIISVSCLSERISAVVLCFAVMAGSGLEFCAICAFVCIQEYQKCGVNVNVLVNCMYSSTVEGKRVRAEETGRKSHDRMVAGEIGGMWDRWDSCR